MFSPADGPEASPRGLPALAIRPRWVPERTHLRARREGKFSAQASSCADGPAPGPPRSPRGRSPRCRPPSPGWPAVAAAGSARGVRCGPPPWRRGFPGPGPPGPARTRPPGPPALRGGVARRGAGAVPRPGARSSRPLDPCAPHREASISCPGLRGAGRDRRVPGRADSGRVPLRPRMTQSPERASPRVPLHGRIPVRAAGPDSLGSSSGRMAWPRAPGGRTNDILEYFRARCPARLAGPRPISPKWGTRTRTRGRRTRCRPVPNGRGTGDDPADPRTSKDQGSPITWTRRPK
jgi:hypothetical protein